MLPFRMIEYVVAHELTHLIEPQHSDEFWMRLERLVPAYEECRRWLAEEGALYGPVTISPTRRAPSERISR